MCGIIAYVGRHPAQPVLLEGLRRLEYRGYDGTGLATADSGGLHLRKCAGNVRALEGLLADLAAPGTRGIGHTRWATHGPADSANAHPHLGGDGLVAVAHNGVIDNHLELRCWLEAQGASFQSQTDTEAIAHLVASFFDGDLAEAVVKAVARLHGSYALAVLAARAPDVVVGACLGSPLVLGAGTGGNFLASDPAALAGLADQVAYLQDRQLAVLTADGWQVLGPDGSPVEVTFHWLDAQARAASKEGFAHYMLREIHEQPEVVAEVLSGRLEDERGVTCLESLGLDRLGLWQASRLLLTGCGTSYHAALVGEYLIESLARLPVEVDYAGELRDRDPPLDGTGVAVALSQSGETADTLAAVRTCKACGVPTLALCNVEDSSLAREADGCMGLRAGPEIGVASTKAFAAQVVALTLLARALARRRDRPLSQDVRLVQGLRQLPEQVRQALACRSDVERVADKYVHAPGALYLGRGLLYPVALEGALKLQEVAYVNARGLPAAEMKHGPLALVDRSIPVVILALRGPLFQRVMSNLEEVRARGAPVIAVACEGDEEVASRADEALYVPDVPPELQPVVAAVPLQLLAYAVGVRKGCDVDRPRHLAKSVTVE